MKKPIRPVMRYYGGKWKVADWVISHFPKHRCYVEGFGGAGSVLMKKPKSVVEIYNDRSKEIVGLFQVLRCQKKSKELMRLLELTPWSRDEWLNSYELSEDLVEQARRTIVLAHQGHNPSKALNRKTNGWRSSSSGHHKLGEDFKNYISALQFVTDRLKYVMIENRPAKKVCMQHDRPTTLHYLDPPYIGDTRSTNTGNYYQHEMRGIEKHVEMLEWSIKLEGFVLISSYPCKEYSDILEPAGWQQTTKRTVTGAATKGGSFAKEVLWMNPRTAESQKQLKLSFPK